MTDVLTYKEVRLIRRLTKLLFYVLGFECEQPGEGVKFQDALTQKQEINRGT